MLKYTQFMPSEKMKISSYNRTRCLPVSEHLSWFFQYGIRNWKNGFKWSETVTCSRFSLCLRSILFSPCIKIAEHEHKSARENQGSFRIFLDEVAYCTFNQLIFIWNCVVSTLIFPYRKVPVED